MKSLIVNADDFGLHTAINQAILYGHTAGCITSTSLMAMGNAFEEAVGISLRKPSLGVGVHLTLVAERPVLPPDQVPTLVDKQGRFATEHTAFIRQFLQGAISLREVSDEFTAQIERVRNAGVQITHLDSHQHLHVLPRITEICIALAKKYRIKAMRIPAESYFFTGGYPINLKRCVGKIGLTFLSIKARKKITREAIAVPAHFFGMLAGGHLSKFYLQQMIAALPEGTSEIMMHPGNDAAILGALYPWEYQWEEELNAALDPSTLALLRHEDVALRSFRELS